MKKFFTIAAAILFAGSMMAQTETTPSSVSKDVDYVGTAYTFNGTYIAGAGSAKVGDMPSKGVKVRLNRAAVSDATIENALEFTVNEDYQITGITIVGITNDNNKAATVGTIYVDGVAWDGTFDGALPAKNASAASNIVVSNIAATQSVIFAFSDLGGATQANITYTIEYEAAIPSTEPELSVNPSSINLDVIASATNPSANVTFKGKNLTAGTYNLTVPNLMGLTVNPTSVTVGEDGKLNATVTIAYTSDVERAANSTTVGLTIGELTQNVTVNFSANLTKNYMSSVNIEQWVLDNGTNTTTFKSVLDAAHIEYANIDALDTLNDNDASKTNRNYPFLGLKMKKTDAKLAGWLQAGHTINVRFGNVGANFIVRAAGQDSTCTATNFANTSVESDKVLTFTAPIDMYLQIICNSTKTLVVKQIMVDSPIANITLPIASKFKVTCNEAENGTVKLANGKTSDMFAPSEEVVLVFTSNEGYALTNATYNDIVLTQSAPGAPISFIMPAENVTVNATFGDTATGIDEISQEPKANSQKLLINGQLFIEKNGVLYNAQGAMVK